MPERPISAVLAHYAPAAEPDDRDPYYQAGTALNRASDAMDEIGVGQPLGANDRAALDRAIQWARVALARLEDVERLSRPPIAERHPGDGTPIQRSITEVT